MKLWTDSEVALLDELARAQATNTQAVEMFPDRTVSAVLDKYRKRIKELGISRPRGNRGNIGSRAKNVGPHMLPKDAEPAPPTTAEQDWVNNAKLGCALLLEGYERYFANRAKNGTRRAA